MLFLQKVHLQYLPLPDGFNNLPKGTLAKLLEPENKETLQSILTYHVVAGKFMATDVVNASTIMVDSLLSNFTR